MPTSGDNEQNKENLIVVVDLHIKMNFLVQLFNYVTRKEYIYEYCFRYLGHRTLPGTVVRRVELPSA